MATPTRKASSAILALNPATLVCVTSDMGQLIKVPKSSTWQKIATF